MGQWVRRLIQLITFGGLSACMQYAARKGLMRED